MDPTLSCGLLYLSFGLLIWLASMDMQAFSQNKKRDVHVSFLSPQKEKGKKKRGTRRSLTQAGRFPCHRMCCGPDTLLWFALSVFRVADMMASMRM